MIDLAAGYRSIAEILARHGLRASYALSVQVWYHELDPPPPLGPAVTFTASVIHGARCLQAHECPTLETALAGLDATLTAYLAEGGQSPEVLPDLRVVVPTEA